MSNRLHDASFILGSETVFDELPRCPLSDEDIELLANVSERLLRDKTAKQYPDVVSFAFWCRGSHLNKLKRDCEKALSNRLGRGLAFHIAPSNVPVNFAFSWAFSLLAGNCNIVRVPSRNWPQVNIICEAICGAMSDCGDSRSAFITYPRESDITSTISAFADVRLIWGGDATVAKVRSMPAKPRSVDIPFSNRRSLSVINGNSICELDERGLESLARSFYNDTYQIDQNACSSPTLVCWLNPNTQAKEAFWSAVRKEAYSRYELYGSVVMDKFVKMNEDAIEGLHPAGVAFDPWLSVVDTPVSEGLLSRLAGRGGYFYQTDLMSLNDVFPLLDESCQTLTYFGLDPEDIRRCIIASRTKAIDRVVPMGKALDIDVIWDGMDLLSVMSRIVDVR